MKVDLFSEEEVISGCKKGERRYQEILYRRFARKMYALCLSYAGNRGFAQDILQEAFIKVFKNIAQYQQKGSLEGWIRRIVTNTAIDMLRQNHKIESYIEEEPLHTENASENEALDHLGSDEILAQVARLPEGARVIFNLYAMEGYTHKEIAQRLKISTGTSKSQFNRARQLLQNYLTEINT